MGQPAQPVYNTGGLWRGMQPMQSWASPAPTGPRGYGGFGGNGSFGSQWPCPNCGIPGHGYKMCTIMTGMPLDPIKIANHIAELEQRDQIKDVQTAQINQALAARGLAHLQRPLPSELKRMRGTNFGNFQQSFGSQIGYNQNFRQQQQAAVINAGAQPQPSVGIPQISMQPQASFPEPALTNVTAACVVPQMPPPPNGPPPEAACATEEWVVDWGVFRGVITNAHTETTKRLQPLRGYRSWSVSDPWTGFLSVVFDTKENAEHAEIVLRSIAMTTPDGKAYQLETKGPMPKGSHPMFAAKPAAVEQAKRDSGTMKEPSPDPAGDLTMSQTEADIASKVTPEAKRYRRPVTSGSASTGAKVTDNPSSSSSGPTNATTDATEPENLPVAAVLRFEALETAQRQQGAAIEAQGKKLESLESKVNDTSTQVGLVGNNVKQMLRAQQEQAIKNSREWHSIGELDAVGRRHLRGSVKKPKTGTAYYIIAAGICGTRYTAHQALVRDTDGPRVFWRPMADGVEGFSDNDDHECTPEWVFEKVEIATEITGKLNHHLDEQHSRLKRTLGEADAVILE